MKSRHGVVAATVGLAATGSARAQTGVATYSVAFNSPAGPNTLVLQPGETTHMFVSVSFTPTWGGYTAAGLSDGSFSITAPGSGDGMWAVDAVPTSPTYSLPHPWGAQNSGGWGVSVGSPGAGGITGVLWGYGFILALPHPYPQNPAIVYRCTFTAGSPGEIDVAFSGLGLTGVFMITGGQWPIFTYQSSPGAGGAITIIPEPCAIVLVGLGGALGARRCR